LQGDLFAPGDAGYDEARLAWNRATNQYPALILSAASAADIVLAVRFARAEGLGIAVQSTGHGVVTPADGALLVLTSRLADVQVDAESQTAGVGAGAKWGAVLAKTQEYGLAPLLARRRALARSATRSAAGWAGWRASMAWRSTACCASKS